MKKVSIKDIANKAGASITTVSIVLNGNGPKRKISQKMINNILKISEDLNYRPNQFAKSLRTGKTHTIGLIVDDISNFFFGHLAKTVEEEANKYGYTVMFCNSKNDDGKFRNVLGSLREKQMDGYIVAPTQSMLQEIRGLEKDKIPFIFIDRFYQDFAASHVTLDNFKGSLESVYHFVEQNYRMIAIVTADTEQLQIRDRLEGYLAALERNNIAFRPELVKKIPFKFSDLKVVSEIESFIASNPQIDAVLFTSNNLGVPGLQAIRNAGRKVAKDIAVICFDDNDLFRLGTPAITVVSQPIKSIGKKAVKVLINSIENKNAPESRLVLSPNLIVRQSTPFKMIS